MKRIFVFCLAVLICAIFCVPAEAGISENSEYSEISENSKKKTVPAKNPAELLAAIAQIRKSGVPATIRLTSAEYHFSAKNAETETLFVSNHDQPREHKICLPLTNLKNLTLDGNGAKIIFHGASIGVLLRDCENVTLKNLSLDYARSLVSQAIVKEFKNSETRVEIDKNREPFAVENGKLIFIFDGDKTRSRVCQTAIAFRKKSHEIVPETSDIVCGNARLDARGNVWLKQDLSKIGAGIAVGDALALRDYSRPHPAICLYRATNTRLENVRVHASFGMAILAQRSENFTMIGGGVVPASKNRYVSTPADATHFSNCRGEIRVENARFEGMLDDAINVHSTCLQIQEIPAAGTLRLRYMHPQAIGFEVFQAGEMLRFIRAGTLENAEEIRVRAVKNLSEREILVELEKSVPAGIVVGDAVENADFQPSVIFCGNVVCNNRARGALFTTPKPIICRKNHFKNVAGSAILLAGDASGWFESGACRDVEISENIFENCLTSRFQFTEGIISIYPNVKKFDSQREFYHRNIRIERNIFETFDVPFLFAASTDNLVFRGNKIRMNKKYRAWNKGRFQFLHCGNAISVEK